MQYLVVRSCLFNYKLQITNYSPIDYVILNFSCDSKLDYAIFMGYKPY
jgi:hypothetical protein